MSDVRCPCCCQIQEESAKMTHLELYVNGSEGVKLCVSCRVALTTVLTNMMSIARLAYMSGVKQGKGLSK